MTIQPENMVSFNTWSMEYEPIYGDSQLNNKRKCSTSSSDRKKGTSTATTKKQKKTKRIKKSDRQEKVVKGRNGSLTTKGFKRHFTEHNYHDYSNLRPSDVDIMADTAPKGSRGGVHNPFPTVLHKMMEEAEDHGFSSIISWQSHGRAFLIHEPKVFVADILPKYFKHSKLSSFQRQLSLYGFVRLTNDGRDRGCYYHECFLRQRTFLCCKIHRTRVKGTWVRTSSSPESEPNFYAMEPVVDLDELDSRCDEHQDSSNEEERYSLSSSNSSLADSYQQTQTTASESNIERHINEALTLCSSSNYQSTRSPRGLAEEFFDDIGARIPPINSLVEAGLKPPPAFPNTIVTHKFVDTTKPTPLRPSSSFTTLFNEDISSIFNPCKLPSIDKQMSLLSSLGFDSSGSSRSNDLLINPIAEDTELAQFLTDVDLDTDLDTDDVMQISSV